MTVSKENIISSELVLGEPFKTLWQGQNVFEEIQHIDGTVVRSKEGRTTKRCDINGHFYYTKVHTGVGWGEIIKNYIQLRKPVTGAENEWQAIHLLQKLGIKTLELVAWGKQKGNLAKYTSFIATKEIDQVVSLAVYTQDWSSQKPTFKLKQRLIREVASIAKTLHDNGLNHRDLYICHFLLQLGSEANPIISVVDLHRAQIRSQVPERWLVKDVASIYFSAMDIGLTKRDVLRFLRIYFAADLRVILIEQQGFLQSIKKRAERLYWRDFKRKAPEII